MKAKTLMVQTWWIPVICLALFLFKPGFILPVTTTAAYSLILGYCQWKQRKNT